MLYNNNHGIFIDMKKSKYIKLALCLALGCFLSLGAFAQEGVPTSNDALGGVGDDKEDDPPIPIPLDGGVSILIAACVGYGAKKYRDYLKEKNA